MTAEAGGQCVGTCVRRSGYLGYACHHQPLPATQDFAFHVLRNCFVVLMVARDENASFTIFSCLNGRGMDLTVVDKLKAELLQVRAGRGRLVRVGVPDVHVLRPCGLRDLVGWLGMRTRA